VYNSLQPYFDYFSVVWGNCGVGLSEKKKLQTELQNHAACILLHESNEDDIDMLIQALDWRKLSHQRPVASSVMMFKTPPGLTPEYLQSRFTS